jgi:hypothetical protein
MLIGDDVLVTPSLTFTLNGYKPGPCASVGVQLNTPVLPPMVAPVGAPVSENVSACAGVSLSVAVAVNVYGADSGTVAEGGTPARIGATFASVTVRLIGDDVLVTPSVTLTENGYVPGPCASVGVQLNAPLEPPMLAPVGAPTRENVSVWIGVSLSVAVAVNVYGANSGTVAVGGTPARTGAAFASVTVMLIGASAFATPSLTRTVNGYEPGPCASVGVQLNAPVEQPMLAPGAHRTARMSTSCGQVRVRRGRGERVGAPVPAPGVGGHPARAGAHSPRSR